MKLFFKIYRVRKWLWLVLLLLPIVVFLYSIFIEPYNIKVTNIDMPGISGVKLVHISDLHYEGDKTYITRVIDLINRQDPDYVFFTGDFLNESQYLDELLDLLDSLKCPLVAVPGNHEFWLQVDMDYIDKRLRKNGGRLLLDGVASFGPLVVVGLTEPDNSLPSLSQEIGIKVLMCHYPAVVDQLRAMDKYDIILCGHTHAGQVRLPGYGPLILPYYSGGYDYGLFETKSGPMYVTSGVGWLKKIRFNCRPEIVVIE